MKNSLIHIIIFLISAHNLCGQISAEAKYSKDSIRIGEQLILELTFKSKITSKDTLNWPEFDSFLTNSIEIIERSEVQKTIIDSASQTILFRQNFLLTCFEEGSNEIEPIKIPFRDSIFLTQNATLFVASVPVDTSNNIYDIKPIQEVEYDLSNKINDFFIENWHWFIIGLLVVIILVLLYFYSKRKKPEIIVEIPKIPAHITALKTLRKLSNNKAWEHEDKKAYYSSVTDTVRKYLEERFEIQAMEETTAEIIKDLKYSDIISKDKFFLEEILKQADMVKFAKFKPDNQDGEIVLGKSIEFVEQTKEVITKTEENRAENE